VQAVKGKLNIIHEVLKSISFFIRSQSEQSNFPTLGKIAQKKPADMQPHNEQQANQKTPFEQGNSILT